jgi:hypothetical protein
MSFGLIAPRGKLSLVIWHSLLCCIRTQLIQVSYSMHAYFVEVLFYFHRKLIFFREIYNQDLHNLIWSIYTLSLSLQLCLILLCSHVYGASNYVVLRMRPSCSAEYARQEDPTPTDLKTFVSFFQNIIFNLRRNIFFLFSVYFDFFIFFFSF